MMKHEFEALYGHEVSSHDYETIIEPMYMATELSKQDFVKLLDKKAFKAPAKEKTIKVMLVRDNSGYMKTPNGCWYHIEYVEWVGMDIKTGKYIVKPLTDEDFDKLYSEGRDLDHSTYYDFDYMDCLTTKRKPVELKSQY